MYLVLGTLFILGLGRLFTVKLQTTNNKYKINFETLFTKPIIKITPSHYPLVTNHSRSIFIPYWANRIREDDLTYDEYYYFGIQPTKDGSIEDEIGLQNIPLVDIIPEKQKKLVLRMLDSSVTEVLLQDITAQKTLISRVKSVLQKYSFSGLILDGEVPFTLQANKKEQITKFVQLICTAIKSDYKTCGVLVYGDYSYRSRPYDLKALGEAADTILIMAYDFHKAGGEPGPNFPFDRRLVLRSLDEGGSFSEGGFDYGYDFKQMISDVTAVVPKEKIEIVFGMYGYDWTMNEQGTPLKTAQALSLKEIQALNSNSKTIHKNSSLEKQIEYTDEEGKKHIIWYEDEESAAVKTKYLEEQGIWQVSFWAQSYF